MGICTLRSQHAVWNNATIIYNVIWIVKILLLPVNYSVALRGCAGLFCAVGNGRVWIKVGRGEGVVISRCKLLQTTSNTKRLCLN